MGPCSYVVHRPQSKDIVTTVRPRYSIATWTHWGSSTYLNKEYLNQGTRVPPIPNGPSTQVQGICLNHTYDPKIEPLHTLHLRTLDPYLDDQLTY